MNLDQTNTTRFLFGDDEPHYLNSGHAADESFPTLVRRDDQIVSTHSFCFFDDSKVQTLNKLLGGLRLVHNSSFFSYCPNLVTFRVCHM